MAKVIVITGAGSGLGRALARRFAAAGDTLVLLGRTLAKVQTVAAALGGAAMAIECDVTSADSVRAAFAAIAAVHPVIDVLINNAAIYEPLLVKEATDAQILGAIMTNFAGPIFCCREAIPMMQKGAHIINISSESVHTGFPMFSMYQSTKAGLERFAEALQKELADDGIRVTTVRAGQMYDEDASWNVDPETARRFGEACAKAGINPRTRPISHFNSVAEAFYMLANMPADLQTPHISLEARRA